jgi:ABC-type multidrug transport system ATPase subunit
MNRLHPALPAGRGRVPRLVAALALLLLGAVALVRLPLGWQPESGLSELQVGLSLPSAGDPGEVTREWVQPIESAVRSLGRVRGITGRVGGNGASFRVVFETGTDVERKGARLLSELRRLRSHRSENVSLFVEPVSGGAADRLAVVLMAGEGARSEARRAAEQLRRIPGVREVEVDGATSEEITVRLAPLPPGFPDLPEKVEEAIRRNLAHPALGSTEQGGRRFAVLSGPAGRERIADLPIALPSGGSATIGSLARIELREAVPAGSARWNGEPAVALRLTRERGSRLLPLGNRVEEALANIRRSSGSKGTFEIVESEWEPLRRLLRRFSAALALATVGAALAGAALAGAGGAIRGAIGVPLALAGAANLFWLARIGLDVSTLPALLLGTAGAIPLLLLRIGVRRVAVAEILAPALAAGAVVLVAVALGAGSIAPVLAPPARAFALAFAGGAAATALLPAPSALRRRSLRSGLFLRRGLRDVATPLLAAITLLYSLFAVLGKQLDPRSGSLEPDGSRLSISLSLPPGTTLAETEAWILTAERRISRLEGVSRNWSWMAPGEAWLVVETRPGQRDPESLSLLRSLLLRRLRPLGGALELQGGGSRSSQATRLVDDQLEERSETSEDGTFYRAILRTGDSASLGVAVDRIRARASQVGVASESIQEEWGAAPIRFELRPRPGTSPATRSRLAEALRRASSPARAILLPGEESAVRIVAPGEIERPDDLPQRRDLLDRPLATLGGAVPSSLADGREIASVPALMRQSGRFVLPVTFRLSGWGVKGLRDNLDRSLSVLLLPPGCDLERPDVRPHRWTRERVRAITLAALVPLLLLAAAILLLDSAVAGAASLFPLALALALATPLLALGWIVLDEATLLSFTSSLAAGAALGFFLLHRGVERGRRGSPPHAVYRTLREAFFPSLFGAALAFLLLFVAGLLASTVEDPWANPVRAGAVVLGGSALLSLLLLPPALLAALGWKKRDRKAIVLVRHPPEWIAPEGPPSLVVRSLTKRYRSGFRALADVDFRLGPGVVGLLGPNGAGKTTLLRLLTGLLSPTRGQIVFRGAPVVPENLGVYRRHIGFLPQEFNAYPGFTAEEFLAYWAIERGLTDRGARDREIAQLLEVVGLTADAKRKVRDYSGGMRQRIGIARALLGSPPLLVVDEPTTGLDVESRNRFREVLLKTAHDRIVLLSTHIAGDVEATAGRILLIHRGRLRWDGTPSELVARARGQVFETLIADSEIRDFGRQYRVTARVRVLAGLRVRAVAPPGAALAGRPVEPNLEEAYLAEIDRAEGRGGPARRRTSRFSFLEEGIVPPAVGKG